MGQKHLNAWGDEVEDIVVADDPYAVPKELRVDVDEGPLSDASGAFLSDPEEE